MTADRSRKKKCSNKTVTIPSISNSEEDQQHVSKVHPKRYDEDGLCYPTRAWLTEGEKKTFCQPKQRCKDDVNLLQANRTLENGSRIAFGKTPKYKTYLSPYVPLRNNDMDYLQFYSSLTSSKFALLKYAKSDSNMVSCEQKDINIYPQTESIIVRSQSENVLLKNNNVKTIDRNSYLILN